MFLIFLVFCVVLFVFFCFPPLSCIPNGSSVSGLSVLGYPIGFLYVVLFALSVFLLCLANPMVPVSLDCPFLVTPSVFSVLCYLFFLFSSFVLHTQWCQCLWIVRSWLPHRFSLCCVICFVCSRPLSCIPNSDSVSGLSILGYPIGFLCVVLFVFFVFLLCLAYPMVPVSLDCPFFVTPSVFSVLCYLFCLFSSFVLHTQWCQCLWIVRSGLPHRFSLCCVICFFCFPPLSCIPNGASVSGLSVLGYPIGILCVVLFVLAVLFLCLTYPIVTVSLDCPLLVTPSVFSVLCYLFFLFSSFVLHTQ